MTPYDLSCHHEKVGQNPNLLKPKPSKHFYKSQDVRSWGGSGLLLLQESEALVLSGSGVRQRAVFLLTRKKHRCSFRVHTRAKQLGSLRLQKAKSPAKAGLFFGASGLEPPKSGDLQTDEIQRP